jgi:hypothetical protein
MLPLIADMSGFFAIDLSGEIKGCLYDTPTVSEVVTDEQTLNSIMFRASKRFPELASLVPERPYNAIECPACNGSGYPIGVPEHLRDSVICSCGGLGWIPNEKEGNFNG